MAACRALRHNPGMNRFPLACFLLLCGMLPGCDAPAPTVSRPGSPPLPQADGNDGRIQWQARLPCADCAAIDTRLVLQRDGADRDYTLTETYLATDGGARFVERGQWRREDRLLRLQGADGGRRAYALLADGSLQATDSHGRPLSDGGVLVPVTAAPAP